MTEHVAPALLFGPNGPGLVAEICLGACLDDDIALLRQHATGPMLDQLEEAAARVRSITTSAWDWVTDTLPGQGAGEFCVLLVELGDTAQREVGPAPSGARPAWRFHLKTSPLGWRLIGLVLFRYSPDAEAAA